MGATVISTSIPNLINGISQQPSALRNVSQGEEQINAYPSVVEGLVKRPPTQHVTKISTGTLGAAHIHTINRDITERYQVLITNGDLLVYDIDGTSKTVAFPDGKGYLTAADPVGDFKSTTVADFTFISNSTVTTAMEAGLSTSRTSEALVFVKIANYSTDYAVDIDGFEKATHLTGTTGALKTTTIAIDLESDLDAQLNPAAWAVSTAYALNDLRENDGGNAYIVTTAGTSAASGGPTGTGTGIADGSVVWSYAGPTGFTVVRSSSTIHLVKDDGTTFDCQIRDSRSNTQMRVATDKVQRFSDLPTIAPAGYILEVMGDETSAFDNYYVVFETNGTNATFDEGVWVETVAPGIEYIIDAATMPHQLVRESDGSFTFSEMTLTNRTVGDLESSPNPSFIGAAINDVFFEDNRLSFLSDQNVIQSRSGEFFTFFQTTVTTVVESDVIDTAASHTKVSILRHAVPFNEQVLLFSDQSQFSLEKNDVGLKEIKVLTEFESAPGVQPVGAGRTIYFVTEKGSFSGVREYYSEGRGAENDAADITAHVPKYLPTGITKLAVDTNEEVLVALAPSQPNRVYVYKYYWSGQEKLQSAWNHFEFSTNAVILNVDFIGSDAYFLVQYPDALYLEKMGMEPGRTDPYGNFEFLLDRKVSNAHADVSVAYDAGTNLTTWTLPYVTDGTMVAVVRAYTSPETTTLPVGTKLSTGGSGASVTASGDHSTTPVWLGETYNMTYQFSEPSLKENTGQGKQALTAGRLQVKFWELQYDNSGYFTVEVTPEGRTTQTYKYTGNILGATSAVLGEVTLGSGVFKAPVMSKSDRFSLIIKNDSFLPSRIVSAGYEGMYSTRSKRV